MEDTKERVLAYQLATELSEQTIKLVSGGASRRYTYQQTNHYSGRPDNGGKDLDDVYD